MLTLLWGYRLHDLIHYLMFKYTYDEKLEHNSIRILYNHKWCSQKWTICWLPKDITHLKVNIQNIIHNNMKHPINNKCIYLSLHVHGLIKKDFSCNKIFQRQPVASKEELKIFAVRPLLEHQDNNLFFLHTIQPILHPLSLWNYPPFSNTWREEETTSSIQPLVVDDKLAEFIK